MNPLDKCKAAIRAAITELEHVTGMPVLSAQMVALRDGAMPTYHEDPTAVGRTISVGLVVSGRLRVLPWLDDED